MADIEVSNVVKVFDDGFTALNEVSFLARSGEFVTLLGPSGCGKTTLLKVIAGFHEPTRGRVRIGGTDVTEAPPEHRDTAMCFQSYALFPHLTVADNIDFGPRQNKVPRDQRLRRLDELLRQVDLEDHRGKLPNALSGGQQQRVALARALAMRPGVVLFDEPLSNLDAKLREQVRFEIRALQRQHGFTAIYVTHDQAEALAMSDRILVMRDGVVEQAGTPEDIYFQPQTSFVADFVGGANLLRARVTTTDGTGRWRIETELGSLTIASKAPPVGDEVFVSWRPEDAVVGGTAEENQIEAPVIARAFQGAWTDVFVAPPRGGNAQYRLQIRGTEGRSGETIGFSIAPDRLRFLEARG